MTSLEFKMDYLDRSRYQELKAMRSETIDQIEALHAARKSLKWYQRKALNSNLKTLAGLNKRWSLLESEMKHIEEAYR